MNNKQGYFKRFWSDKTNKYLIIFAGAEGVVFNIIATLLGMEKNTALADVFLFCIISTISIAIFRFTFTIREENKKLCNILRGGICFCYFSLFMAIILSYLE